MALVSVCILCILVSPVLAGTSSAFRDEHYRPIHPKELDAAMAMARINRCTTIAGALDAYAKGLIYSNGVYLAMASPLSRHPELEAEMRYYCTEDDWVAYHIDTGQELSFAESTYFIYNLLKNPDSSYSAWLHFTVPNSSGGYRSLLIAVRIRQENGWVVEESGERFLSQFYDFSDLTDFPAAMEYYAAGETGTVSITSHFTCKSNISIPQNTYSFWKQPLISEIPVPNAVFEVVTTTSTLTYAIDETEANQPETAVSIIMTPGKADDAMQTFTETSSTIMASGHTDADTHDNFFFSSSGSSNQGESWRTECLGKDWNGILDLHNTLLSYPEDDLSFELPKEYTVLILWDGKLVETVTVKATSLNNQKGNSAYD